jgi:hypothetical protein
MPELADLERDLLALGAVLEAPSDKYLATRVRATIERAPKHRRRLVIIVAALIGIAAISAPVVADWLHVGRVDVRQERPPVTSTSPLELGRRTTLPAARSAVGFTVVVPTELGAPDEVWIDESGSGDVVWLAYRPRVDLPEAQATGYGALVAEIDGSINEDVLFGKFVEPNTTIEHVDVGSGPALWIDGVHSIGLVARGGDFVIDSLRLSDKVLLWERGDVTLRLESSLDKDASVRIARSAG